MNSNFAVTYRYFATLRRDASAHNRRQHGFFSGKESTLMMRTLSEGTAYQRPWWRTWLDNMKCLVSVPLCAAVQGPV